MMAISSGDVLCRRAAAVAVQLWLLVGTNVVAALPERPKSVFWEPYEYDADTTALFHFEQGDSAQADSAASGGERGISAGGRRETPNSAPMGAALLLGAGCELVADGGKFGGALRFDGHEGMVVGDLPAGARTIEFWALIEKYPAGRATMLEVLQQRGGEERIALEVDGNGRLFLKWGGSQHRVLSEPWRPGVWRHYALAWDGSTHAELRIDGDSPQLDEKIDPKFGAACTKYALGNALDGRSGFCGLVDELRCSRSLRESCKWNLGWVDLDGKRPVVNGRPYFRDRGDLVLHLDFNRRLDPAVAPSGTTCPAFDADERAREDELEPEKASRLFADGVERQSLILSRKGLEAEYHGSRLILPERGTVAFWVRPLNWDNSVRWNRFAPWGMKYVPIFMIRCGEKTCVSFSLIQTPDEDSCAYPVDLNPGTWTHICAVWEGRRTVWYVNGIRWMHGGSWQWRFAPWPEDASLALVFARDESECALDDFRIYSRALSPSEIANLAAMFDVRHELRPLPDLDLILNANGVLGRVDIETYLLHPDYAKAAFLRATVIERDSGRVIGRQEFPCDSLSCLTERISTERMRFASYDVKAEVLDADGRFLFGGTAAFDRNAPPWWGNRIGISERVMPDWKPIEVKGGNISVAMAAIEFSDSGLPELIVSKSQKVIAGPVAMTVVSGDGSTNDLLPVPGSLTVAPKGEVRVDFEGRSAGGGLIADTRGYVEFDGMMWFRIAMAPAGEPVKIRSLVLKIPYEAESSRFIHWWSGNHGFRDPRVVHVGVLPSGEGMVFRSTGGNVSLYPRMRGSFMPYVMLCGDQCGMAWFAQNDKGWTQSTNTPAVAVERYGGRVELRLNIITELVELDRTREFEFGLHPIPVRELKSGWRATPNWGVFPDSFCGFNLKGGSATDFFRHPENMDWEAVARRFKGRPEEMERQGVAAFRRLYHRDPLPHEMIVYGLYYDLRRVDSFPQHTREWGELWPAGRYLPEIVDYFVWIWDEWLRRGFAKGVYMDDCYNAPLDALESGVAYELPDGHIQPGFQWLGQREMLKRFRQACWDRQIVPHMCAHTTHTYFIPYHSFFDTILDGEDFYQYPQEDRDFMDSWPPERLRFMHPSKWGPVSTWLGWTAGGTATGKYPTWTFRHNRAYVGALLVHDLLWTVGLGNYVPGMDDEWVARSRIRVDPAVEFVPYWENCGLARHDHEGLFASAWRRPDWCLVALANWTTNRMEAAVRLDPAKMGFGSIAPDEIRARDVDPHLLAYFDDDASIVSKPEVNDNAVLADLKGGAGEVDVELEEKPSLEQRKASDPDGFWEWRGGVLKCAVRRHDFRLFEFSRGSAVLRGAADAGRER